MPPPARASCAARAHLAWRAPDPPRNGGAFGEVRKLLLEQAMPSRLDRPARSAADIHAWLTRRVRDQLEPSDAGGPPAIDPRAPFTEYGIDSVDLAGLLGDLAEWLDRPISGVLAVEHPSIEALARHLGHELETTP